MAGDTDGRPEFGVIGLPRIGGFGGFGASAARTGPIPAKMDSMANPIQRRRTARRPRPLDREGKGVVAQGAAKLDMEVRMPNGAGKLYVVATPIGNLGDLSPRAAKVLGSVKLILAEDTRVSQLLLANQGIQTPLRAYHAHNEARSAGSIIERLRAGDDIALISDAGTPAISDPGAIVVREAHDAGIEVLPIPGPNAAIAALSASGIEGPFLFVGFLPAKPSARRQVIERWREFEPALVFYEAPHRIEETLTDLAAILGDERILIIARELTKRFEQVHRCPLGEAASWLASDANRLRGEFVLIVSGVTTIADSSAESERVLGILLEALPLKQAVALTVKLTGPVEAFFTSPSAED